MMNFEGIIVNMYQSYSMGAFFTERCYKAHSKLPYRWEINKDDKWTIMPDNETIEKDYSDPKNSYRYSFNTKWDCSSVQALYLNIKFSALAGQYSELESM